jgi:hypothetical protein
LHNLFSTFRVQTMKLSAYLLGLLAVASPIVISATANAQVGNGSDNGNTFTSIVNAGGGGVRGGGGQPSYPSASQSAVDQFSQSLTANSLGDQATFDTINGGDAAPLVAALVPSGVPADGATGKAAANLATTVQGMRGGNGNINATKLSAAVPAYNEYVKALVGELGPEKALASAPNGQKALQGLLSQLVQVASQSAPSTTPSTPSDAPTAPTTPTTPSTPTDPTVPAVPSVPSVPPAPPTPR